MGLASLTSALQIAISGMQTSQAGLSTVAHNITNADTEGYHRQTIVNSSVSYDGSGGGVQIESVSRQINEYLQARLFGQMSSTGYTSEYVDYMQDIESVFGDPTDQSNSSLDKIFTDLFRELSNLANDPDSSAQKNSTVQQAVLLTETLQNLNTSLNDVQTQADNAINESIATMNTLVESIFTLNQEIAAQEGGGTTGKTANDLRDQRDTLVENLASYLNVQVTESNDGTIRIVTQDGRQLVDSSTHAQFERTLGSPFGGIGVRKYLSNGELSNIVLDIDMDRMEGGTIKASVDVRDTVVPELLAELDNLTTTFMTEFNDRHSQGSSYPPQNSFTSGDTSGVTDVNADLFTELSASLSGSTFNISVVDSTGDPVYTTVTTGLAVTGTGAIAIPGAGPFSLQDLADLINNNADIGNTALGGTNGVLATATTDSDGNPVITIAAADSNLRVVFSNESGDVLGTLGMNNFFTGTSSSDIAVRSDIQSSPELIAFAQMRMSDGGLSSLNNDNAIQLAEMSEFDMTFSSAGGLPTLTDTTTGYVNQLLANLAVDVSAAEERDEFATSMLNQMEQEESSVSGVNVDEELSLMLIYQNSFQASARIISTVDEMLEYLIQSIG